MQHNGFTNAATLKAHELMESDTFFRFHVKGPCAQFTPHLTRMLFEQGLLETVDNVNDVDWQQLSDKYNEERKEMNFVRGIIHLADEPYDEDRPEYDCYMPVHTGDFSICDCLVCNREGLPHPGYLCPVPVRFDNLGEAIGVYPLD